MSRQELAEAVVAKLYELTGMRFDLDANYIGRLERGGTRWPATVRRRAFRDVLAVESDAQLGFYILRGYEQDEAFLASPEGQLTHGGASVTADTAPSMIDLPAAVATSSAKVVDPAVTVTIHDPDSGALQITVVVNPDRGDSIGRVLVRSGSDKRVYALPAAARERPA